MLEKLLSQPGFIYEIDGNYYFLGKWICKESLDVNANDFVFMYQMCHRSGDEQILTCISKKSVHVQTLHWKFLIILPKSRRIWNPS